MRVLHLIKTAVGATWALRQVRELVLLGVDAHVALPPGGPMVSRYTEVGAVEHLLQTDFPIRSLWKFPALVSKLSKLINTIQPDIIHSHFVGTTLSLRLALGRRKPIPRVFQVPGPLHLEHALFRYAELLLSGQSDYWIGSCHWTCKQYEQSGIDSQRVFMSYYGTDIDSFTPRTRGKLRSELGISPEYKIVGMVAFMYPPKRYLGQKRGLKGHEDLIDAIKICIERDPRIVCVIVGGAWNNATNYEETVKNYARQQCGDRVIFLGTRNDVPDIYADVDVAVHPSHSENVGGAVESCLLGVPTIATNIGGFPDLIRNGITGWLVPPKDPKALAITIMNALENKPVAEERARAGQILAHDLFDVRKTAGEIKNIYKKIINRV